MRFFLMVLCLSLVPSFALAQIEDVPPMTEAPSYVPTPEVSQLDLLIQFASDTTMCRTDGISVVRESQRFTVLNVCGVHRLYRLDGGNIRDLGPYQTPRVQAPASASVHFMDVPRLRSQPGFWGTGLALFIASYGAGIGATAANVALLDNAGFATALATIPIVGNLVVLTQIRDAEPIYGGYVASSNVQGIQIGIGVASTILQIVGWGLIWHGSRRVPVQESVRYTGTGFEILF